MIIGNRGGDAGSYCSVHTNTNTLSGSREAGYTFDTLTCLPAQAYSCACLRCFKLHQLLMQAHECSQTDSRNSSTSSELVESLAPEQAALLL